MILLYFVCSSDETAFDHQSSSLIRLNNNTILYLREVNKFLALVCILREENFNRQGVIDYNFLCFRDAISEVFELRLKNQRLLPPLDERLELRTILANGGKIHNKIGVDIDDDDDDEEDEDDVERDSKMIRGQNGNRRSNHGIGIDGDEEDTDEHPNVIGGISNRKILNATTTRRHSNDKNKLRIV